MINRGVNLPLPLWSAEANFTDPEIVLSIHQDYISAGADIITTNTFRTTTYSYRKAGYTPKRAQERAKTSLMNAVDLARKAVGEDIQVVGSITAVDDCYSPELYPGKGPVEDTYGELIEWFSETEIDLLLFETMGHYEEIKIALEASRNIESECWFSLILKDGEYILDEHSLEETINLIKEFSVSCLMLNCNTIETTQSALELFLSLWTDKWGVYSNLGVTEFDNDYFDTINDYNFKESISLYLEHSPSVIGACCGSNPKHIKMIKNLIN
ncbi:MAG: homocysteine S-methyltransferase family protein [Candidatus Marinimicrobia bacterium]|nr:homocysteine S-methyltransferase family protein [Candidatus Neomarinimicrobiota bacterium]MBT3618364.1 homocysteine S-methyltransferase family protein [Candidatus Neomarinimicrobiota bacterium]MBT3829159.1 homocysteine S-methyltransferase family protein [Candidatus Neomarinimicrobiota bacterium]MBT3998127.1 homocysteine S-methyltransferase family protein [Candidatus Neomarinimicrobiota bacterium]MBT4281468.1 homocysteine S-methyltransferase family protein [Candidatus Neomarinimicrobiota bact